jgi:uncharacterized lipoprotein NlpE involved in copper resistance
MKMQYLFLILVTLVFSGCKNEQKDTTEQTLPDLPAGQAPDAAHNSQNSLDWEGTYKGTTPCLEPCKGIMTEITIKRDSTYSLSVQAIGQEETPRTFKGTFYWDKSKNGITLDANGDHHKFKVQEGSLKELDKFGDPKQLGKQEDYILKKQ